MSQKDEKVKVRTLTRGCYCLRACVVFAGALKFKKKGFPGLVIQNKWEDFYQAGLRSRSMDMHNYNHRLFKVLL